MLPAGFAWACRHCFEKDLPNVSEAFAKKDSRTFLSIFKASAALTREVVRRPVCVFGRKKATMGWGLLGSHLLPVVNQEPDQDMGGSAVRVSRQLG